MTDKRTQSDKFKGAAREHKTELDKDRWNERVRRIAQQVNEEKPEKRKP